MVVEEYGLGVTAGSKVPDEATRTAGYRAWTGSVEAAGAGDPFWLLTSRVDDGSFYPDYDGYRMVWDASQSNPTRGTVRLLVDHAAAMARST